MTIHRPGRPGDLPPAEVLWARWALACVLAARTEDEGRGIHRVGTWIDGSGLHLDDSGCTWWTMEALGHGRYVLYGEDESSQVKWHKPPVDMLAGGPDWLPYETLRDLLDGWQLGCVYWYENGAWARAPYPETLEDDGLDCGIGRFAVREEFLREPELPAFETAELAAAAEEYRLEPRALEELAGRVPAAALDLPAAKRALALAGLTAEPGASEPEPAAPAS
ncbi:hypothetical protein HYE82_34715 [Streptomyces sp. BR123]|uniref:hypothetical protein n=1 Tax=Streptomyces sp. BR123 TaxID=2749828 RepID=UPI0015C4D360|nr:hypothetical protein [Streptomyces sp. BR123]NXY99437.1 hypothetical protein [Streptomyces sp. BR123]